MRSDPLDDTVARRLVRRLDHEQAQPQAGALQSLDLAGDEQLGEPGIALEEVGDRRAGRVRHRPSQDVRRGAACSARARIGLRRLERPAAPSRRRRPGSARAAASAVAQAVRIGGRDEEPGDAVDHSARDRRRRRRPPPGVRSRSPRGRRSAGRRDRRWRRPATARRPRRRRAYSAGRRSWLRAPASSTRRPARPSRSPPRAGRAAAPRRRSAARPRRRARRIASTRTSNPFFSTSRPTASRRSALEAGAGRAGSARRSTPCGTSVGRAARARDLRGDVGVAGDHAAGSARRAPDSSAAETLRASRAWALKPYGTPSARAATAATAAGVWAK